MQTHPDFADLDGKLNKRLDKLEKLVIETKKGKQLRDRADYENNKVYIRTQFPFQSRRPRKNRIKKVSFSDIENDVAYDTLATSGSESSPDRPNTTLNSQPDQEPQSDGHPHGNKDTKKRKSTIKRPEGEARGAKTTHTPYALRGTRRK